MWVPYARLYPHILKESLKRFRLCLLTASLFLFLLPNLVHCVQENYYLILIHNSKIPDKNTVNWKLVHDFGKESLLIIENSNCFEVEFITLLNNESNLNLICRKDFQPIPINQNNTHVLFVKDNVAIVNWTNINQHDFPLSDYIVHNVSLNLEPERSIASHQYHYHSYQSSVLNSSYLKEITSSISPDSWSKYVLKLENFGTRYFLNTNRYQIADWLCDELKSFNIHEVEIDSFYIENYNWGGFEPMWQSNVVGCVQGSVYPDEYLILGAHYDSIISPLYGNPLQTAPGADDNASGVASALEVAKALSENSYYPKKSIIFALFGAEEIGLKGSTYLAEKYRRNDYNDNYRVIKFTIICHSKVELLVCNPSLSDDYRR